ncbi:P-loop NTPase family protein [Thalassoglobus polymorphus]|uniref:DNA repair protein n=1 Tax=Thalassoglobus polymorphus TaxID=2527994 RepID=A0A517QJE7_9PLAN|nr:DNA repair protein [Thalassoglobus polymorphus]QDT31677.1 hypothetical protein Mal48_09120 [Thalassoglobus polymorphus]
MSSDDLTNVKSESEHLQAPESVRRRTNRLIDRREERVLQSQRLDKSFRELNAFLDIADDVSLALEQLSEELFQQLLGMVQEKLTIALQEILDQPVKFRARPDFKRGAATVEFYMEREGYEEDILRGQGGSVANILSVGLRMFALMTLDETEHRRFLVLDEQDCWLRPDLVPGLVKMVQEAGQALGFQVLMISHHESSLFEKFADRIYRLSLNSEGSIQAEQVVTEAGTPDGQTSQSVADPVPVARKKPSPGKLFD